MFGVVEIVPEEARFWLTLTAARVEAVSASAATVRMITSHFERLTICMIHSPLIQESCIKT